MTEAQAIELVAERFAGQWPTLSAAVPLPGLAGGPVPFALENEGEPIGDYFASCSMTHTTAQQITTGPAVTRKIEVKGYVMVKLWVPGDNGRKWAASLATVARAIFNGIDLPSPISGDEPVTILAGATREIGVDGRWYMEAVTFPFRYYDVM